MFIATALVLFALALLPLILAGTGVIKRKKAALFVNICAVVCVWSSSAGGSSSAEQRVAAPAESVSASVFLDNPVRRFSNFCHREAGLDRVRGSSPRIASPRALTATGS